MVYPVKALLSFLQYWYFRYTLVMELYMVEKWERYFMNIFLVAMFCGFLLFNYKLILVIQQISSYTASGGHVYAS